MDDLSPDLGSVLIAIEKGVVPPDPAGLVEDGLASVRFAEQLLDFRGRPAGDQIADLIIGSRRSGRGSASQEDESEAQDQKSPGHACHGVSSADVPGQWRSAGPGHRLSRIRKVFQSEVAWGGRPASCPGLPPDRQLVD